MFGFNNANYDLNLIKSHLLPILVNERDLESTVIKTCKLFISFEFGDFQLLDILIFLGGAKNLDSLLKAYKISETKGHFPYERLNHRDTIKKTKFSPYGAFYSKICSCNPLEVEYGDCFDPLKSGMTTKQAIVKLKLTKPPPARAENYQYLQQIWKQQQMSSFRVFFAGIPINILFLPWRF